MRKERSADGSEQAGVSVAAFDWTVYADATAAGLATLIPVPGIDWIVEQFFRRRMPRTIAARRKVSLQPAAIHEIVKTESGCVRTCLLLPILGVFWLLKRLSKKILYFLTVKEAADQVSLYWHEAFLIDQMIALGHLANKESAAMARQAMQQVITNTHASPVYRLAFEVVRNTHRIGRTLIKIRRGQESKVIKALQDHLMENWDSFQIYFSALAALYQQAYRAKLVEAEAQRGDEGGYFTEHRGRLDDGRLGD